MHEMHDFTGSIACSTNCIMQVEAMYKHNAKGGNQIRGKHDRDLF